MNNLVHNGDEPIGLRDKWEYNQDFKLDWHDGKEAHDGYQLKWVGKNYARLRNTDGSCQEGDHYPRNENGSRKRIYRP